MDYSNGPKIVFMCVALQLLSNRAYGSSETIGADGIDSKQLGLTGQGEPIGMVENLRPGKEGYDTDPNTHHSQITLTQVYFGTIVASANFATGRHATSVAGMMIATDDPDSAVEGVSPETQLHAAGIAIGVNNHHDAASALNGVAKRASEDVRAINMSFGFHDGNPDGRSTITQFVDWSAIHQDVLYVAAYDDNEFLPGDNFNGITVGSSQRFRQTSTGRYRQADTSMTFNNDADGDRTSIDILAPGVDVRVPLVNDQSEITNGSSFAAPHVVGTVALLQQYATQQMPTNPRFDDDSRKHQVMKALLLNSADKLKGVHGSTRTVVDQNEVNWRDSIAYSDALKSLDEQMGAGHLNARRAHVQFKTGEWDPGTVPLIGWDYGSIGGAGSRVEYVLDEPLAAGQYIAVTLAWDRRVEKNVPDNTYSYGDIFFGYTTLSDVLTNLNLYLLPASSTNMADAQAFSLAIDYNLSICFSKLNRPGITRL